VSLGTFMPSGRSAHKYLKKNDSLLPLAIWLAAACACAVAL